MADATRKASPRGTRTAWAAENVGKHLCACGCANPVAVIPEHYPTVKRFLHGHNMVGPRTAPKPRRPCGCGCGLTTEPGNRYINTHFHRPRTSARHLTGDCACGCGTETKAGSLWVKGHHQRVPLAERFSSRYVVDDAGCWRWQGRKNYKGYGYIGVDGKHVGAHRVSYRLHKGAIPAGLEVDHLCHVRDCVNPEHLEAVTHAVNVQRRRPA